MGVFSSSGIGSYSSSERIGTGNPEYNSTPAPSCVQKLQVNFATMSANKKTKIVKFGTLGFRSQTDAWVYIKATPGAKKFDLLTDIYHFTMLMKKEIYGEDEFIKLLKRLKDIGLKSTREAIAVDAFSNPIPPLFHNPSEGIPLKGEPSFSKFSNHQTWKDNLELIIWTINTVQTGLEASICTEVPASSPAHSNFLLSMSTTVANLTSHINFNEKSIKWWVTHGMASKDAYALATRLSAAFFRECHCVALSGVSTGIQTLDRDQLATQVWYGVCLSHDVTKDFVDQEWQNHGSI
mmetsp:Transcript_3248/g.4956  ORF Transcript_3248/g.4956 Transcript_3248/m.4956 type:complete len:294 (-) Transcript_3248:2158-3039(-)